MRYANSVKYLNSFDRANDISEISAVRVSELCQALGRINMGPKYIHISGSGACHGCALFIESILKNAGYRVGRINTAYKFDIMKTVYIDRQIPGIDDYNKAVAAIRQVVNKNNNDIKNYKKEEIVFVFSLLICMLEGCEFVILEECMNDYPGLLETCAPYEIAVIPSVYEKQTDFNQEQRWGNIIKLVKHEVISGNQKTDTYNIISDKCRMSGTRLTIPAKAQFIPIDIENRSISFEYKGKSNFKIKSISLLLRDCAMTAIELCNSLRRAGIKISGNAIADGLVEAGNAGFCDIISSSPFIISDISYETEEISVLYKSLNDLVPNIENFETTLCFNASNHREAMQKIEPFNEFLPNRIYIYSPDMKSEERIYISESLNSECFFIDDTDSLAKLILKEDEKNKATVCFGGIEFTENIKKSIVDAINDIY